MAENSSHTLRIGHLDPSETYRFSIEFNPLSLDATTAILVTQYETHKGQFLTARLGKTITTIKDCFVIPLEIDGDFHAQKRTEYRKSQIHFTLKAEGMVQSNLLKNNISIILWIPKDPHELREAAHNYAILV